jgi:hypothetical protein
VSKVVVRRTTIDNRFTLTQTWTRDVKARAAIVVNALKANVASTDVYLARAGMFDAGFPGAGAADWSGHSYWVRSGFFTGGRLDSAILVSDPAFSGPYVWGVHIDVAGHCGAVHSVYPGPLVNRLVYPMFMRFSAGDMAAGQTKKFSVTYRGQ